VFANDPEKEGDMFTHVCQYLCFYVDGRTDDLYGKLPGKGVIPPDVMNDVDAVMAETGDCRPFFTCALLFYDFYSLLIFSHWCSLTNLKN